MCALIVLGVWSLALDWRVSHQERRTRCAEVAERAHRALSNPRRDDAAPATFYSSEQEALLARLTDTLTYVNTLEAQIDNWDVANMRRPFLFETMEAFAWLKRSEKARTLWRKFGNFPGILGSTDAQPNPQSTIFNQDPPRPVDHAPSIDTLRAQAWAILSENGPLEDVDFDLKRDAPAVVDALGNQEPSAATARLAYHLATWDLSRPQGESWRLEALTHATQVTEAFSDSGFPLTHLAHYHLALAAAQSQPNEVVFPLIENAYRALARRPSFLSERLTHRLMEMESRYPDRDGSDGVAALARIRAYKIHDAFTQQIARAQQESSSDVFQFSWENVSWLSVPARPPSTNGIRAVPLPIARHHLIQRLALEPLNPPKGVALEISYFGHRVLTIDSSETLEAFIQPWPPAPTAATAPTDWMRTMAQRPPAPIDHLLRLSDDPEMAQRPTLARFPADEPADPSPFSVRVALIDPAAFNAAQNARLARFSAVVLAAVLLSALGLVLAQRAFERQVEYGRLQSDFVSSVSHELRTPIASIRLMAENLDRQRVSNPQRAQQYYRFIRAEAARLGALVDNTLDLSRIERGKERCDFQPTSLRRLVEGAIQSVTPMADSRNITLSVQWPETEEQLGAIWDGNAVQRALINLLDNAVKHAPNDGAIHLQLTSLAGQETFEFRIIDHGDGIEESLRERVFDRFFRIETGHVRNTAGAGIGLALVRHTAQTHGGDVWIDDTPGGGATVVLRLPILPPASREPETA